jgi:hypothetical protein
MWLTLITAALGPVTSIINKLIPDPDKANEIKAEIEKALIAQQGEVEKAIAEAARAQIEINLKEAESPSLFVAGWRPFLGWVCGVAFACTFLVAPFFTWISAMLGGPAFPTLDSPTLTSLTMGLLGLGTMRTVEKVQGVDRQTMATPSIAAVVKAASKPIIIKAPAVRDIGGGAG